MRPVLLKWRDAHAVFPSWAEPEEIGQDDFTCETVGWLLPSDTKPGWHVVVLSRTHQGLVGDGIAIADEMVVSVEDLAPKAKKPATSK